MFSLYAKVLNFVYKHKINIAFEGGINITILEVDGTLNFITKSYNDNKIELCLERCFLMFKEFPKRVNEDIFKTIKGVMERGI